ncbi:MAG: hypothetical protein K2N56_03855 [Oscillospiraceae bacterium]|nr:hypothetical protein [Oscillospiraceae bacterium]
MAKWNPDEEGNYAWLTQEAKNHGGVTQYIEDIESNAYGKGYEDGEKSGTTKTMKCAIPAMIASTFLGMIVDRLVILFCDKQKQKKQRRLEQQRKADDAKLAIINKVNEESALIQADEGTEKEE